MHARLPFLVLLLALLSALPAASFAARGTPLSEEWAARYVASCTAKRDTRMRPETQAAFCACTAAESRRAMTLEDIQTMGGQTQEARLALNKMMLDVYVPCMRYPVTDMLESQCMADPQMRNMGRWISPENLCFCVAGRTGLWFEKTGGTLMGELLAQNPNLYDPISPVMDSRPFQKQVRAALGRCLTEKDRSP